MADDPRHQSTRPDPLAQLRVYGKYYPCAAVHDAAAEIERLRALLREWVEADRELRAHPENDRTKRWSRKLYRLGAARDAAEEEVAAHA